MEIKTENTAESSSAAPPKPVVVRVKRKPSQSPLDAFWLEINDRPLKRSLLDFGNLSLSEAAAQKEEFHNKKVLVQHVETICSSEVTFDIVQSFVDTGSSGASVSKSKIEERKNFFKRDNKQDQLLVKAKQEKESLAKDARFEQIWKSRNRNKGTANDKALQEICHFYDIVRVDNEEKNKEVQREGMSLEDQQLLSSYLPLLREFIPNAAAEVEADLIAQLVGHPKEATENYVYDLYTVKDEADMKVDDSPYPLVQVEEEDYYDGPDDSDYESDDSNAENNPLNDYPDEISEEDEEVEDSETGSENEHGDNSNESSDEDKYIEHDFFKNEADPLYDEDFDEYGVTSYDAELDDDDWRWSYR